MAKVTDFSQSYMTWSIEADLTDTRKPGHMPWGNSARILIDARCTIYKGDEVAEELYLIAPCRTEWMYRENDLIQIPSGEYRVIFTQQRQLFVGKKINETGERGTSGSTSGFTALDFTITEIDAAELPTDSDVVRTCRTPAPINATIEIADATSGLRAVLEFPVRTMNFHEERQRFQVDTGPIIFPDLALETEHLIDRCKLAHTVYNTRDYAEFICKQPTPIEQDGETMTSAYHYSEIHRLAVKNQFFGVGADA